MSGNSVDQLFVSLKGWLLSFVSSAPDWVEAAPAPPPLAAHGAATNQQWRIAGALNALTGRVDYLDDYVVGRRQLGR